MEGGAHRLGATKVSRGLHEIDVRVQVLWETVLRRADENIAVDSVLPYMKFLDAASKSQCQNSNKME